jgi:muconate cycloisomerase
VPIAATRIEDVDTILVDLPTIRPHQLSMTTMKGQTLMIVRIRMSDGIVGIGEGTTIGGLAYGPESPEGMKLAIDTYVTPILLQSNPNRIGPTMVAINQAVQGNNFAKCAVETALVDALGERNRLPASELLGGRCHDQLPVSRTLASGDTGADIAEAEEMLARRRYNIFKLKIGRGDPQQNITHVAAIKSALGERASVRVDINQAWSEAVASRCVPQLRDAECRSHRAAGRAQKCRRPTRESASAPNTIVHREHAIAAWRQVRRAGKTPALRPQPHPRSEAHVGQAC